MITLWIFYRTALIRPQGPRRGWLAVSLTAILLASCPAPAAAQFNGLVDFLVNHLVPGIVDLIPIPDRKPTPPKDAGATSQARDNAAVSVEQPKPACEIKVELDQSCPDNGWTSTSEDGRLMCCQDGVR